MSDWTMLVAGDGDFLLSCGAFKRAGIGTGVACGPSCRRHPADRNVDPYVESPPEKIDPDGLPNYDQSWSGRRLQALLCGPMADVVGDLQRSEWARVAWLARRPLPAATADLPVDQQLRAAGVRGLFDGDLS